MVQFTMLLRAGQDRIGDGVKAHDDHIPSKLRGSSSKTTSQDATWDSRVK